MIERCTYSDLPADTCSHCTGDTLADVESTPAEPETAPAVVVWSPAKARQDATAIHQRPARASVGTGATATARGPQNGAQCRWDRTRETHLTRECLSTCIEPGCKGCRPCTHEDGHPVRHCRARRRCTSHLGWDEFTCPTCLGKIRSNLTAILETLALMPDEATEQGIHSEPANLAGPHADYVRAQWRLINADRNGESVEELDMRDPYTCLTMHEREIREALGHDEHTLVSSTIAGAAGYLDWVLTDLARDEERQYLLGSLLGDAARLRGHVEAALRDSRTPERGIPCPDCVKAGKDAQRLVRHYAHWCERPDCAREHRADDSGDTWRCDDGHTWSHEQYEQRLTERRGKVGA